LFGFAKLRANNTRHTSGLRFGACTVLPGRVSRFCSPAMKYHKPALTHPDLLARWQAKGLHVKQAPQHFTHAQRYYCLAVVMRLFSRPVDSHDEWPVQLLGLFKKHLAIPPTELGFPAGWEAAPLWN
jgi:hypothetical protein